MAVGHQNSMPHVSSMNQLDRGGAQCIHISAGIVSRNAARHISRDSNREGLSTAIDKLDIDRDGFHYSIPEGESYSY